MLQYVDLKLGGYVVIFHWARDKKQTKEISKLLTMKFVSMFC